MNVDLSNVSAEDLEAALNEKREKARVLALEKREAYEGIRGDLISRVFTGVENVSYDVQNLAELCNKEAEAFRQVMAEYGQLRTPMQKSFTVRTELYKWEVKCNKVKKFDERADVAASRLIEFLKDWITNQKDGFDNPMYQLAMTLLERNKYGDLDYKSVSKLYDLEAKFNNDTYSEIMTLFKESHLVESTAINHYFYKRDENQVWKRLEPSFNRM